ncbi:hypothetical protein [Pseudoalteromonas aurantia]|uniref:Uncharacterized protein n=1 Tax=Pseudoalteromonas aurantia TaxID=43654 RepID=A0ABY2VYU9_9GAMM|nr:hypothetical protein [Pseudoalteromonas aurantia]TMO75329.1 hypothetical protein CWC20_08385 [Pseudoalteromonas aurantia]
MQKVEYTKEVAKVLRPALYGARGTIKREIQQGISQLHRVGELYIVTRIEADVAELVVVAVAGRNLIQSVPVLLRYAKANRCSSIRWHARSPEHIQHAFHNLPIELVEIRKGIFYDEHIFRLVLNGR